MEFTKQFIDIFLHLDKHLSLITHEYGVLVYLFLFVIIFCETGLVITPFLPGDSLVFATGALAASGAIKMMVIFVIFCAAAIIGDTVNYHIGRLLRNKVNNRDNMPVIKKEYLDRTHSFFKKHGGKTIIIARFIPIIRTFAPFVAGAGEMLYAKFISFNIIGGIAWVALFLFGGYFFGNLPFVKNNFSFVILGIIVVSLLPGIVTYIQSKYNFKKT
jgi:membrane-associated protein